MKIQVYTHSYSEIVPTMKIKVYFNGKRIQVIEIGCESEIELPVGAQDGDLIEFKLQYFKAKIVYSSAKTHYFIYWDVPANPIRKQLKLLFTNCLRVISVDKETFAQPHVFFKVESPSQVVPNAFINIVGLAISSYFIFASILLAEGSETWRDFAMIFGLSSAFRFLSFAFSKNIYRSSGFQSTLIFSIIGIVIVLAHGSLPISHSISALAIFAAITAKAHMYYVQGREVAF